MSDVFADESAGDDFASRLQEEWRAAAPVDGFARGAMKAAQVCRGSRITAQAADFVGARVKRGVDVVDFGDCPQAVGHTCLRADKARSVIMSSVIRSISLSTSRRILVCHARFTKIFMLALL